ncbi:MAG: TIGR01212 family radical SAM protein [Mogibacterium sp.]|nr:TIGR01212 family radical SAM protein [Mogibacterium sp.]
MQGGERYNSINDYLKSVFGKKTVKLSIDAGFTCPNRDGSKGFGGCAFCSGEGSGDLASHLDISSKNSLSAANISDSITEQINRLSSKWHDTAYLAYFQSFTNTYASIERLRRIYYAALSDERISGIAIATRPDCLSDEVLELLDEINKEHFLWVELGLQSIHAETQQSMNLCYKTSDYDRAAAELARRDIRFVTHIILGLPGETEEMILDSVRYVCSSNLPCPFGIKLHLMNIVKTAPLYSAMPDYKPFESIDEYVDLAVRCLEIIPADITIHRLTGDVPRKILVSPEWSYRKRTILNKINKELALRDTRQGAKIQK